MNTNELTLDGYLGLELAARMSAAGPMAYPHTADRWEEGEQHVWPKDGYWANTPRYEYTEQDVLWEKKLWVTMTVGANGAYVSPRNFRPGLQQDVTAALGRPIKLIIKVDLQPWECNPKKRVLTESAECERKTT